MSEVTNTTPPWLLPEFTVPNQYVSFPHRATQIAMPIIQGLHFSLSNSPHIHHQTSTPSLNAPEQLPPLSSLLANNDFDVIAALTPPFLEEELKKNLLETLQKQETMSIPEVLTKLLINLDSIVKKKLYNQANHVASILVFYEHYFTDEQRETFHAINATLRKKTN